MLFCPFPKNLDGRLLDDYTLGLRSIFKRVVKGGSQSHFPPEIFPKSQSQLDFY